MRCRHGAADGFVLLVLLAAGLRFTRDLSRFADIRLWDDANYMRDGIHLFHGGFEVQYGPLYSLYYWVLSLGHADPVAIQMACYRQTAILLPLVFYVLLRAVRVPLGPAWILAGYSVISYANLHLENRVGHAALILLAPFCALAMRARTLPGACRWMVAGTLLASYIRPEFFLGFLMTVPFWIAVEVRAARATVPLRSLWRAGAMAAACTALILGLGPPAFGGGQGREMLAFSQHFAIRWKEWHGENLNPGFDYRGMVEEAFGRVNSPAQAFLASPITFLRFVAENAAGFAAPAKVFLLHFQLPAWVGGRAIKPLDGICLAFGVLAAAVHGRWRDRALPRLFAAGRLWLLVPVLLPPVLSGLLVFPIAYYLLPCGFIGIAALLGLLYAHTPVRPRTAWLLAAGAALQLLLTPSLARTEFPSRPRVNLAVVERIRGLHTGSRPLHILEADGGYGTYLAGPARSIYPVEKDRGFLAMLREEDINLIVAGPYLEFQDERFRDDPEWRRFLEDPTAFGFRREEIPGTDRLLFLRSDLLPEARPATAPVLLP
jgi:hypothetical protein